MKATQQQRNFLPDTDLVTVRKVHAKINCLDNQFRQHILKVLSAKERSVTEIMIATRYEQSVVSNHLGMLRKQKFVTTRREGKFIYYSINTAEINGFLNLVAPAIAQA